MTYVGIDVSKVTFVVAYSSVKTNKTRTFKNTVNGVHEFVQTISASEHNCVLEATGNYSALLVYLLSEAGITISLENPLKIKNFARVMLTVTKTDEIDARLIALYGEKMQPAPYKLRSDAILVLIIQSFQSQIHNTVILVIADVVLEELAAAVVGLIRHFENLLGKGDERIFIQIYYMLQTCCKCF